MNIFSFFKYLNGFKFIFYIIKMLIIQISYDLKKFLRNVSEMVQMISFYVSATFIKNVSATHAYQTKFFQNVSKMLSGLSGREDSDSSATEAVYSSDLVLPYQFPLALDPQNQFYEDLRNSMSGFRPVPACHNTFLATNLPEHVPISLSYCPIVFIWKDSHEGPYKVLTCAGRTFPLQIGRVEVVSQHGALNQDFTEETPAVSESVIFNLILLIIGS